MTDLEMTKLCADAAGEVLVPYGIDDELWVLCHRGERQGWSEAGEPCRPYWPLLNDAQAMALEDWLIERGDLIYGRHTMIYNPLTGGVFQLPMMSKTMRRRAIVECVAKMQASESL